MCYQFERICLYTPVIFQTQCVEEHSHDECYNGTYRVVRVVNKGGSVSCTCVCVMVIFLSSVIVQSLSHTCPRESNDTVVNAGKCILFECQLIALYVVNSPLLLLKYVCYQVV